MDPITINPTQRRFVSLPRAQKILSRTWLRVDILAMRSSGWMQQLFKPKFLKGFCLKIKNSFNYLEFFNRFLLIPRLPWRTHKLQKKPLALKREYLALQNMKFLNFFLILRVIFTLLDQDPRFRIMIHWPDWIRIQSGSWFGSETLPSALKWEHPALQNMKFHNFFLFCGLFLPAWTRSWFRIRIYWPD